MKRLIISCLTLFTVVGFIACETYSDEYDVDYAPIYPLSGQYNINVVADSTYRMIDAINVDPVTGQPDTVYHIRVAQDTVIYSGFCYISNTTDYDKDKCWIRIGNYNEDASFMWSINGKINCNVSSLTFSGDNVENLGGGMVISSSTTFSLSDGSVQIGTVTTPSGTVSDRIAFTFTNSRFRGNTTRFKVYGYRYTGWPEDSRVPKEDRVQITEYVER